MKSIRLITLTIFCLSVVLTAFGQQADSVREKGKLQPASPRTLQQPVPARTLTPATKSGPYNDPNRVMIHLDDVPAIMRETLRNKQYRGWKNASIYHDKATGEYSLDINDGGTSPKNYRFDKNGRPIQDPAATK